MLIINIIANMRLYTPSRTAALDLSAGGHAGTSAAHAPLSPYCQGALSVFDARSHPVSRARASLTPDFLSHPSCGLLPCW